MATTRVTSNVIQDNTITVNDVSRSVPFSRKTTSYTIEQSDAYSFIGVDVTGPATATVTIPNNNFPQGFQVNIIRLGTGSVGVVGSGGATIRQASNLFNLAGQYAGATIVYSGDPVIGWILFGDLA